jgi:hypothetical protein
MKRIIIALCLVATVARAEYTATFGSVAVTNNLRVTNNIAAGLTITAGMEITAGGNITAAGDITAGGVFYGDGSGISNMIAPALSAVLASGNDAAGMDITGAGDITAGGDIAAGGDITGFDLRATNNLYSEGSSYFYGPATFEEETYFTGLISGGSLYLTNTLTVTKISYFDGWLMANNDAYFSKGVNVAGWDLLQLYGSGETLPVYMSNVVAIATQAITAASIGALTNETDTLATVTARGNNLPGTISNNLFSIGADYSFYGGSVFNFVRNTQTNMSDLRWYKRNDTNVPANYFAMGPDYAMNTNFFALAFVNKLNRDIMAVGTDDDIMGRFSFGDCLPDAASQVTVVDLDTNITRSLTIGANRTGVQVTAHLNDGGGVGYFIDGLNLARNSENTANWIQWSQGNGAADWRIGMTTQSYDFAFYNENGAPSSPGAPGTEYLRIARNSGFVGVGTNAPAARLHVQGNAIVETNLTVLGLAGIGTASPQANLHVNGATTALKLEGSTTATLWMKDSGAGSNLKQMLMRTDDGFTTFRALNDASDAYTFDLLTLDHSSGRVGIGTTTPSERLHVVGNVLASGSVTASNFVQSAGGWNDLSFPVQNIYAQGLTDIEYLAVSNSVLFKSTCNTNFASDNAWLVGQLPHSAATNAAYVSPHIHFIQSSATQTNMFLIRYKTYKTGGQVPDTWTDLWLTNNVFPYTTGTIHQIAYDSGIPGPFGISQNFDIKIWSRGGTPCQMKYFDVHYRQDSFGSDEELSKGF